MSQRVKHDATVTLISRNEALVIVLMSAMVGFPLVNEISCQTVNSSEAIQFICDSDYSRCFHLGISEPELSHKLYTTWQSDQQAVSIQMDLNPVNCQTRLCPRCSVCIHP